MDHHTDPAPQALFTVPLDPVAGIFSYTRRDTTLTGLTYAVWTSTNLIDWTKDHGADQVAGTPNTMDVETVAVRLSEGLLNGPRLFIRLSAAE